MTKLHFKFKVGPGAEKKLDEIGKVVTDRMKLLMEGNIGHTTKLTDSIKYRVEKNRVVIYTEGDIPTYQEFGTKPHKIRPKNPRGALAFGAQNSGTYKSGKKFAFGDKIVTKVVNHPGTSAAPFFAPGFLLSKNDIENILK